MSKAVKIENIESDGVGNERATVWVGGRAVGALFRSREIPHWWAGWCLRQKLPVLDDEQWDTLDAAGAAIRAAVESN